MALSNRCLLVWALGLTGGAAFGGCDGGSPARPIELSAGGAPGGGAGGGGGPSPAGGASGQGGGGAGPAEPAGPDWRDQVVYFLMTDRFNDGDPSNNDQGANEYDPADGAKYSGGDLKGVADKLDYIQGLGATAVWITPPVANQWWDPWVNFSGYHGYWAENFKEVDKHYGDLETYRRLARGLHDRGMLLVQDVVVNHTGNFFRYAGAYDPADVALNFERNLGSLPVRAPSQPPFDRNDAADPAQRAAGVYHWTPGITDFLDPQNRFDYQLSELDDLNTENPVVVEALKDSYRHWVKEVGVDAFRIDTVIYTPPAFYTDFLHSADPASPGVSVFARQSGRPGFFTFGEAWFPPRPYDDAADRSVAEYVSRGADKRIDSALNFPLHFTLQDVFAGGQATRQLSYRLGKAFELYESPALLLNFVDNHDKPRFLSIGPPAALKQSLLFIMTIPGIPVIYYGTEQAFAEERSAMFAGGFHSGGKDHFDADAEMYRFLQQLAALRREHAAFRRARPRVLQDSGTGPGAFAYALEHEGERALVLFNTSEERVLFGNVDTGLPAGTEFATLADLSPGAAAPVAGEGGKLSLVLEPRAGKVLLATSKTRPVPAPAAKATIDLPPHSTFSSNPLVAGTLQGAQKLLLVVDGNLSSAQLVTANPDGTWSASLSVDGLRPDPTVDHSLVAFVEEQGVLSESHAFSVDLPYLQAALHDDPSGDDRGPTGAYAYPTDSTYAARQADLRKVRVETAGRNLRVTLTMGEVSSIWNPVFGFDHVCVNLYLEVPGAEGVGVLPLANATAPDGLRWAYRSLTGGWINALYRAEGASAESPGASAGPPPDVTVDRGAGTIQFFFPPQSIGNPASLSGVKLYVTTWDYDGGYRALVPEPEQWKFSGADGTVAPLVMDDAPVLTVP
ncbi:MAG TPA: alpha-amylase family glycosyl hydrolase [Polyangiaceae bacterium]|nr:alpha-amylase family glycosyl hydrolase [Polyangiaceae bacterium]